MTLPRRPGQTLWAQIEATLAAEIESGRLAQGERLPPEPALMARFSVSRATVRQAIASLERRGLVRAEQGRGTFVGQRRLHYPISSRTRFSRNLIEQGFDPKGVLLAQEVLPAGPEAAAWLGVPEWQSVVWRRSIGHADGTPIEIGEVFVPLDRFPGFIEARARHETLSATFAAYGLRDYRRARTRIAARPATEEEARLLAQHPASPVFVVTRVDADAAGRPILFGRSVWSAERVDFEMLGESMGSGPGRDVAVT